MKTVPTIVCPRCDGRTYTMRWCECRDGMIGPVPERPGPVRPLRDLRGPWSGCRQCRGGGAISVPCHDCGRRGRRRAQLVFTVGNLDTGQVASTNLVPGAVDPIPAPGRRWWLPFRPIVADLAAQAGVAIDTLYDPDFPDQPGRLDSEGILLPHQWRPDLPTEQRHALVAEALADRATTPWLVLLGHATEPEPPDHPRLLGWLCTLADQLRVDLVIEARRDPANAALSWDIRLELPGGGVPGTPHRRAGDLLTAIATITAEQAASGLTEADPDTPAHYLDEDPPWRLRAVGIDGYPGSHDIDQLERRIVRDAERSRGGQAIWRDRHWWHTSLQPGEPASIEPETGTGTEPETDQLTGRLTDPLRRGWEPPAQQHRGTPIPTSPCPNCANSAGDRADDAGDAGERDPYCPACRGSRRIRAGAVLTVTDLRGRCLHRNWRVDDETPPAALVSGYQRGVPVLQLPEHFQVGQWAATFDVRPADLTGLDGETVVDQHLRDGVVQLDDPAADPVATYLAHATAGLPGARILVRANDWAGPSLDDLARLVLGLGLAIEITGTDHRFNTGNPQLSQGMSWAVRVVDPAAPIDGNPVPTCSGLPEAVARCLRYLGGALRATIPADPEQPIRIPQQPTPEAALPHPDHADATDVADLAGPVRRLAATHPGRPVTARLDATGYRTTITD